MSSGRVRGVVNRIAPKDALKLDSLLRVAQVGRACGGHVSLAPCGAASLRHRQVCTDFVKALPQETQDELSLGGVGEFANYPFYHTSTSPRSERCR